MDFSFKNVSLTVKGTNGARKGIWWSMSKISPNAKKSKSSEEEVKKILTSVSGHVEKGSMLAIIGSSGSGKSSLLDVLSGRQRAGKADGSLFLNGEIFDVIEVRSISSNFGYVQQEDCFIQHLTVRETLQYAFALKKRVSLKSVPHKIIDDILKKLGLLRQAESYVGGPLLRGISGGEKRRLSIGVELVTNPKILFLDEPTSGLDSVNSIKVIEILKDLCLSGECTVIMSIHQPSSTIFHMFDELMLLDKGETVYLGKAKDSLSYFSSLGKPCPQYVNPAEFILDIVLRDHNNDEMGKKDEENGCLQLEKVNYATTFRTSSIHAKILDKLASLSNNQPVNRSLKSPKPATISTQVSLLTGRTWRATRRNESVMIIRTIAAVLIALLVGAIFYQVPDEPSSNRNRINSLLFLMCVFSLFCLPAIGKLIEDRALFYRGRTSGDHGTLAYFLASIIVEIPILAAIAIGYGSISYWMVGLQRDAVNFVIFLAIIFMVINVGFSLSQAIASAVKTTNTAIAVYMIVLVYSLLLGGFMMSRNNLPSSMRWLIYTSYFYYGFEGLVKNEFEKRSYGETLLKSMDFAEANPLINLAVLTGFFILFRAIAYLALRYLNLSQ